MASQRDPQNLKNLTKSAKLKTQTSFESSLGRFHFRNGFPFLDPLGTTFPPMASPKAPKVAKMTLSENIKKTITCSSPNWPQNDLQIGGVLITLWGPGSIPVPIGLLTRPRPPFWSLLGHMFKQISIFSNLFSNEIWNMILIFLLVGKLWKFDFFSKSCLILKKNQILIILENENRVSIFNFFFFLE